MKALTLPNIGFVHHVFNDNDLKPLRDEIKIANEKYNSSLAGHLKEEFVLEDCKQYMATLLEPLVSLHQQEFNVLQGVNAFKSSNEFEIYLATLWVNHQRRYEYNPPHDHGGIWSFALWLDIPYDVKKEQEQFPDLPIENNMAASFNFAYTNTIGKICNFSIDAQPNEIVVFPANMTHYVNPFLTSDGIRTSVSGNFHARYIK